MLFELGTIGALSDGELLRLFTDPRGETAELAFAALVERHGPMVLRVCRSVLRNDHDAQDAFQATFLILVRRAGAVRKRESVGSWLHGVALRVSARARTAISRRRLHEQRAAEVATACSGGESDSCEISADLHHELGRLPGAAKHRGGRACYRRRALTCERRFRPWLEAAAGRSERSKAGSLADGSDCHASWSAAGLDRRSR